MYLDERSWLVGSFFVFFFLSSRRQQCAIGEKEQTKQREAKKSWIKDGEVECFLPQEKADLPFFFSLRFPPPFFLGWAYQEEEEFLVPFQKKAFDEKESTCTKQLDCPAAFSGPKSWFIIVHK